MENDPDNETAARRKLVEAWGEHSNRMTYIFGAVHPKMIMGGKRPSHAFIETDLEPDDLIAMLLLAVFLDAIHTPKLWIVHIGEASASDKLALAHEFLHALYMEFPFAFVEVPVEIVGLDSAAGFPGSKDGCRILDERTTVRLHRFLYAAATAEDRCYLLKPPREMMQWPAGFRCAAPAVAYMGWNWRQLGCDERLPELATRFASLRCVDTATSVGKERLHRIPSDPKTALGRMIKRQLHSWNEFKVAACVARANDTSVSETERFANLRIVEDIERMGIDEEFVMADVLAMVEYPPDAFERATLVAFHHGPTEGPTEWRREADGAFEIVRDDEALRVEIRERTVRAMERAFVYL